MHVQALRSDQTRWLMVEPGLRLAVDSVTNRPDDAERCTVVELLVPDPTRSVVVFPGQRAAAALETKRPVDAERRTVPIGTPLLITPGAVRRSAASLRLPAPVQSVLWMRPDLLRACEPSRYRGAALFSFDPDTSVYVRRRSLPLAASQFFWLSVARHRSRHERLRFAGGNGSACCLRALGPKGRALDLAPKLTAHADSRFSRTC